jgi:CRP-like cAMP-binding protein
MAIDAALELTVRRAFSAHKAIPDASWRALSPGLTVKRLSKGAHLLRAGEEAKAAAFVVRGVLREYYVGGDGSEHNKAFALAGDFTGSYADLLLGEQSSVSIQALSDSVLVLVDFALLLALTERDPVWMAVRCAAAEGLLLRKVERERVLLSANPEHRYRLLQAAWPELETKVPQKHIASYLGITPVTLSRIRQKLGLLVARPARPGRRPKSR